MKTTPLPPASKAPDDLDERIALAEREIVLRNRRIARHGAEIVDRLSSHRTQLRIGVAVCAVLAAAYGASAARDRWAHRKAPPPRNANARQRPEASRSWTRWLPLAFQIGTIAFAARARPPGGAAGWAALLLRSLSPSAFRSGRKP